MRTIDISNITTDREVFMAQVLQAFEKCRAVLAWSFNDRGEVEFFIDYIPRVDHLQVTPDNLPALIQAHEDVQATDPGASAYWGPYLFAMRQLGYPPAGNFVPENLQPLFRAP